MNEQMRRTGGDREPPEHGLKKYWRKQADSKVASPTGNDDSTPSGETVSKVLCIQRLQVGKIGRSPDLLKIKYGDCSNKDWILCYVKACLHE